MPHDFAAILVSLIFPPPPDTKEPKATARCNPTQGVLVDQDHDVAGEATKGAWTKHHHSQPKRCSDPMQENNSAV